MPYSADLRAGCFRINLNVNWFYQFLECGDCELQYYDGNEWINATILTNNSDITAFEERLECALQSSIEQMLRLSFGMMINDHITVPVESLPFEALENEAKKHCYEYPDKFRIYNNADDCVWNGQR